jgi:hypothetical protein
MAVSPIPKYSTLYLHQIVDEIVSAASALAGPGDYFDLDQLPLLDPLGPTLVDGATKKRKRPISVIEITDLEYESVTGFEEFDDVGEADEPTPKKRNPTLISTYTPNARTVLQLGKHLLKQKLLANNAFPSRSGRATLGRESWDASRISLPTTSAGK